MKKMFALVFVLVLLFHTAFASNKAITYRGINISDSATYLDMGSVKVNQMQKFYQFLSQYPNLNKVDMYATRLSLSAMEELMQHFPHIQFGCTFGFVRGSVATNTEGYSTFNRLADPRYPSKKFAPLKYLTNLKALDLGHNDIRELDFLLPHLDLRILILAQCRIDDITTLVSLKNLEYLELFNNDIKDLSPLAGLKNLKHLNLCYNPFIDITPLLQMQQLKRLWISKELLSEDQIQQLEAALPDCEIFYSWRDCTGGGWRKGIYYKTIMKIFKTGVYVPFADE